MSKSTVLPNVYYNLGKRDAWSWLFMRLRMREEEDPEAVLRDIAQEFVNSDPAAPNPHAVWYLKNTK